MGTQLPSPKRGQSRPRFSAGWMHQDATWYGRRPQPRRLGVRWGPSTPTQKGAEPPIFGPRLLWPNACVDQDGAWYGGMRRPTRHCVRWGPSSPPLKGHNLPNYRDYVTSKFEHRKRNMQWNNQVHSLQSAARNFWATVCKTVRPMLSVSCLSVCPVLSVLSVTFVHCDQRDGWIKMKLGMQVGLGPGYIVLDGDPAPLFKGAQPPQFSAHICCGQIAAWIKMSLGMELGFGPGDFVLDGDSAPLPKRGGGRPQFSAHVYCGQTAGWMKLVLGIQVGLSPGDFVLDGDPANFPKRGRSPLPNFRPISIVARRLDASRCHLIRM